jgi:hypothetical protein
MVAEYRTLKDRNLQHSCRGENMKRIEIYSMAAGVR